MINIESSTHSYFSLFYCNNELDFTKIRVYSVHGAPDLDIEISYSVEKMEDRFYIYVPSQDIPAGDFIIEFSDAYNVIYSEKLRVLDTVNTFNWSDFKATFVGATNTNISISINKEIMVALYSFNKVSNEISSIIYEINSNSNSTPKFIEFSDVYNPGEYVYYTLTVTFQDGSLINIKSNTLKHD